MTLPFSSGRRAPISACLIGQQNNIPQGLLPRLKMEAFCVPFFMATLTMPTQWKVLKYECGESSEYTLDIVYIRSRTHTSPNHKTFKGSYNAYESRV